MHGSRLAVLTVLLLAAAPAAAAHAAPELTASASSTEVRYGSDVAIVGSVRDGEQPQAGRPVELQADPYPFGHFAHAAFGMTGESGSYAFTVSPDRNTRYRVATPGAGVTLQVLVDELVHVRTKALPLGRMRVSVRSRHPADLRWGARRAYWYVAEGRDRFRRARTTRTHQSRGATTAAAALQIVRAGRFRFLVCFAAPGDRALGPARAHARCRHRRVAGKPDEQRFRKALTHL